MDVAPQLAEFTSLISAELSSAPELPSFPEVAMRVRQALSRAEISIEEVVRIVSAEPSLAVRLLQLANSVAINPGAQRITTLRSAVARMGFSMARSATIAFAMSQMRRAEAWRGLEGQFRAIWQMSARVAATSFALARHCGRADADQALLAGMLSAMGKLFILTRVSRFPALVADVAMNAEIESVWQARAGRALLARWELGDEILAAACDGDPERNGEKTPSRAGVTLSDVLHTARHLAGLAQPEEVDGAVLNVAAPITRLGLDTAAIARVLDASAAEIASLRAALSD